MLAYVDQEAGGADQINAKGKIVQDLISQYYLPSKTGAALFEAVSRIPGLAVVPNTADGAGRPGIGITWPDLPGSTSKGEPLVVVFDANTYEYLGTQDEAVTTMSIVDQSGQRP
jgi:hypothetical protein